jgi:uncharacterized SAM-binding protein YcdF (DUF218 family)
MSDIIYYALQPWVLPPGLNILCGLLGLLLSGGWPRVSRLLILMALLSLWLFSTPFGAYQLIHILQDRYPALNAKNLTPHSADAILVLAGGDKLDASSPQKHHLSDATLHRIRYAVYLHQITALPIIVSGGRTKGSKKSPADLMAEVLRENFKIATAIKEDQSINTADEGKFSAPILKQHNFKRIYLVTNAWHMPRSMYAFQQAGIHAIAAPMGYMTRKPDYHSLLTYFPSAKALNTTHIAMHEMIGLIWYHIS